MITVKLNADLRYGRGSKVIMDFVEGITVRDIVRKLEIDENILQIILILGKKKSLETVLEDDTIISLYPPIAGG